MPKALGLKKAQKVGASKNQKSILSFLKSSDTLNDQQISKESQNSQSSPIKTSKRKVLSPVLFVETELRKLSEEDSSRNIKSTPKRIKTECPDKSISYLKKNVLSPKKKTPNSENILHINYFEVSQGSQNAVIASPVSNDTLKDTTNKNNEYRSPNKVDKICFDVSQKSTNHVVEVTTPVKESPNKSSLMSKRINKSPLQDFKCFPINDLDTIDKGVKCMVSPSKCGSTINTLDFSEEMCDVFDDDWQHDTFDMDIENLDLTTIQRCEIVSVKKHHSRLELRLENCEKCRGTCFVEGIWLDTPLVPGDIVSVLASRNSLGQYCINNTTGLLVLRPDHLISSTSVVAGVFCKRKAVLQERWRGIDSANMAMTIGVLIHEIVQKALTHNTTSIEQLRTITDSILKESVQMLYDAGLSDEEAKSNIQNYMQPLADFMNTYVVAKPPTVPNTVKDKNNWSGHIEKVLDIEENLCCPQLGLKGKIDATVEVTIHDRKGRERAVVPLEIKSGKASMSAEHRGQLVLYGMMLNVQNHEDPTLAAQLGLLLYLKDRVELREVSCGYPERRDLIMLRNQLVQYLTTSSQLSQGIDQDKLTDIEDASTLLQQKLPEPVDHHNACAKCPYLTLCSLHLWHTNGPTVSDTHPLSKLRTEALGHLSQDQIKYFLHWCALLKLEEIGDSKMSPLHALWTDSVETRETRGSCAGNLKLMGTEPLGDRTLHVFKRDSRVDTKVIKGPQEGEFSIVSIENRPWIAAGVVMISNTNEIHILLERDLSRRIKPDTVYHIDTYESYATTVQNLTNLGVLMEDSDRAERMRRLIINKERPQFEAKLPREVGRLGTKLMRSLNIQQQRAVLKALAAQDYALLQGLPGTGKTQTISVFIQMLVGLNQRVLVTAHTHSAVDTVLCRIPGSVRAMRLGSSTRVSSALQSRTEQTLTAHCETPQQLENVYDSMEVVGVTCLGAGHAMLPRTSFDVCIVDEATQVLQCTVLRPLFAAKKFVLVGDPEQLPPVVRSRAARRLGMEESLFHRLMCEDATSTLKLQYRMNQPIVDISNHVAYSGNLKCANNNIAEAKLNIDTQKLSHLSSDSSWLATACSPELEHAVLFIDVDTSDDVIDADKDRKNFCTNSTEACVVLALVEALKEGNVNSSDIGIMAPYRDQVCLLRRSLMQHGVEVSTVDQFQGRDKPVIIFSCTRHHVYTQKAKEGEVLNDQRRLAVSVTRAKHKLLIIGDSNALQRYAPLQRLITACSSIKLNKNVVSKLRNKYKLLTGL